MDKIKALNTKVMAKDFWGGYLKLSGIVTVIGAIFSAVYIIAMFEPAWWIGIRKTVGKTFNHWARKRNRF